MTHTGRQYWTELCRCKRLKALIVGIDPYPRDSNGIAFSKKNPLNRTEAGWKLLRALGQVPSGDAKPKTFFKILKNQKIGFINLSNVAVLNTLESAKCRRKELIDHASKNILLAMKTKVRMFFVGMIQ